MLELSELKSLHDDAYSHGQVPREQASDDLVFYYVTQWDDNLLADSELGYRGQFDILRKAGRQIMADLRSNPIQVEFQPLDETDDSAAELLDGLYRSSDRSNVSLESYNVASNEAVVCGVGAWVLYTEYESLRSKDKQQVIKRKPVYEAVNNLFWDPNAKLLDKSDANYVSILYAYSEEGYKDLAEELTGERPTNVGSDFAYPEESYTFPWVAESNKVYVVDFYHREKIKDKIYTFEDVFGETVEYYASQIKEVEDDLIDQGYNLVDEEDTERWEVTKYIASGSEILTAERVPGENIPVVPTYGERAYIEGEEYYEGITRLAKDPQRLRNFQMSYLADIVARSPRPKPIFTPEQIQGFEAMFSATGSENNLPYYLNNSTDANGNPLPTGPIAEMPEQRVPQALPTLIDLSRQAVEDVADPGLPQDVADPDMSGKAILAVQNRVDQQSMVYQENLKHAKRRDGEIYAGMAKEVYDQPKKVLLTLPDGTKTQSEVMSTVMDKDTGEIKVLNDLTNAAFDVYSDIGPSYKSVKEQTQERLTAMFQAMDPADPMRRLVMLEMFHLMDGVDTDRLREYANKEMVMAGYKKPETEEEMEMIAQAQQAQEPDPGTLLAMAEMEKAKADQMDAQTKAMGAQIDQFNAETKRQEVQIKAAEAGVKIRNTEADTANKMADTQKKLADTQGTRIDNFGKVVSPLRASL